MSNKLKVANKFVGVQKFFGGVAGALVLAFVLARPITDSVGFVLSLVFFYACIGFYELVKSESNRHQTYEGGLMALVSAVVVIIMVMFNLLPGQAAKMQASLGEVEVVSSVDLPEIDAANAPLVSSSAARLAANQALSEKPGLGSQYYVGSLHKQRVGGKLIWVGFLEPRGFFPWFTSNGSPGYVVVSAVNASDVKIVTEIDGKPLSIKTGESGWFHDDIERVAFNFNPTGRFTEFSAEIDEQGRPYWVISQYEKAVGFTAFKTTGVLVVDAQTKEAKHYSIEQAPQWIDRIISEDILTGQIIDYLEFVHGRFNFSNKDILRMSSTDFVYGKDGAPYFVVGLGTVSDTGIQGILLINSRTGKVQRFSTTGVSESVAVKAAEGVVAEKKWSAANPVPFSISGKLAYVMPMTNNAQVRGYAIVSMDNYEQVVVRETISQALQAFINQVPKGPVELDKAADSQTLEGVVIRIGQDAKSGIFSLVVKGNNGDVQLMTASGELSGLLVLTKPLDKVQLSVVKTASSIVVTKFENLSIGL